MNRLPRILICDDDSLFHMAVKHALKGRFEFRSAMNSDEAKAILRKNPVDLLLLDVQMRTADEGLRAIPEALEIDPDLAIVMSSGMTDFKTVREAMKLGAVDYIPKDFNPEDLELTLEHVLERRTLRKRVEAQNLEAATAQRRHVLIGESPKIAALRRVIEKMRQSPANILITGETGTGKEVVARQLRQTLLDGSLAPFVAVDSATIQSSTAESILFGHEKGAFTGAERATKGIFEEADGGSVYFDEIGNMPLEIQAKLLRVIQEREVMRLGATRAQQFEFRVISATNKNLEAMAASGQFKDDLLQRLNVLPIELPPLRERREDIRLLVEHFLSASGNAQAKVEFTEDAIEVLQDYSWPGNIRELSNVVAYVVTMTDGMQVDVADLPPRIRDRPAKRSEPMTDESSGSFYDRVAAFEKKLLQAEYATSESNVSKLALKLGMDRSHLYTKLREYGIHSARK